MATITPKLGLQKPADAEFGWQQMQRDNTDKIDAEADRVSKALDPQHDANGDHRDVVIQGSQTLGGVARNTWPAAGNATQALTGVLTNGEKGNIPAGGAFELRDSTGATIYFAVDEATGKITSTGLATLDANSEVVELPAGAAAAAAGSVLRQDGTWAINSDSAVNVAAFGAVGDGVADDTTAIQNALNSGNKTILFGDATKTYKISSTLTVPAGVTIEGGKATIDFSAAVGPNFVAMAPQAGTLAGSSIAATADVIAGDYTFTATGGVTGLAADDWVLVYDSSVYPVNAGTYNVQRAEMRRVRTVTATSFTVSNPFTEGYTVANSAFAIKVNFTSDVHIRDLVFIGSNTPTDGQTGLDISYVSRFEVSGCQFYNIDNAAIRVNNCLYGSVDNNIGRGVFYDGVTGVNLVFIQVLDSSQWISVTNNKCSRCRHLFVCSSHSSGQGYYGQPLYITVTGNICNDSMAGGAGSSYAYQHHGYGRFILFDGNIAEGCYAGFGVSGSDVLISNNQIINCIINGITAVANDARVPNNVLVTGNAISFGDSQGANTSGIVVADAGGTERHNICISNNTIFGIIGGATSSGINVAANTVSRDYSMTIDGNVISAGTGDVVATSSYAILASAGYLVIKDNTLRNYAQGIYAPANHCDITGNNIRYEPVGATTGYGIYVNGQKTFVDSNKMTGCAATVALAAASSACVVKDTLMRNCTSFPTDAGTANTIVGNVSV